MSSSSSHAIALRLLEPASDVGPLEPRPSRSPAGSGADGLVADNARIDADHVRRALDGDADAFASLVTRYQRRAFWIAYHVIGDLEEARDVAQESFLRVHRSLARFDFDRSFYTWFYRIVMNLAIDRLRKLKSARAARLDDVAHALPGLGGDSSTASEHGETRSMVWTVLDLLDAKFRAVLVLRDIHGLSCQEIAPILHVTHATVRWRLHRGRKLFKEQWERRTRGWA